jgi:protein arginine N-methyltransferase 7
MHALTHVDTAAERLLAPGAVVVPAKLTVRAQLIQFRMSYHSGLDLSALNIYRWHPYAEQVGAHTCARVEPTRLG